MRSVADAESARRQNRGLVLTALRRGERISRTQLAAATGLSNASVTAITGELINQGILAEGATLTPVGVRGRPQVQITFDRRAAFAVIIELDVALARCTLVDYGGQLVDRTETAFTPESFVGQRAADILIALVEQLQDGNPNRGGLRSIAISVQGILDPANTGLGWSPIQGISGQNVVAPLTAHFGVTTSLQKRGRLLAEGARLLYPQLAEQPIAAVFVGSTVAMGLSLSPGAPSDIGATEFGHMNHIPYGALCRCGQMGCIEAYAADYGVLRNASGVPDKSIPEASVPAAVFRELVHRAKTGQFEALEAFKLAGRALGFGLSRLMTVAAPTHVVITGPGAHAYELMRSEIDAALQQSLVTRINGLPQITVHHDEREPIFQGMLMATLRGLDAAFAASGGDGKPSIR